MLEPDKPASSDTEALRAIRAALAARQRTGDLGRRRANFDASVQKYAMPAGVTVSPEPAFPAEWSQSPEADPRRVVLYLHGGGYILGSLASHRHLVAELGRLAGARTLAIDYRLAPEHPFPAALDDALAAYRHLLSSGHDPHCIAVAGDSAGGGLSLALMLAIRDGGLPQPACAWCISPWTDLATTGETLVERAAVDPFVAADDLRMMVGHYLGESDRRQPLASPLYADLRGLAPLLIQVGSDEVLLDDSVRLARAAGLAEVRVSLEIWPGMIHIWPLFYQELTAGRAALECAARFIRARWGELAA